MRSILLFAAVTAFAVSGSHGMQFTAVTPAGSLHALVSDDTNLRSRALATCTAPTAGVGCFDAVTGMQAGVDELTKLGGGDGKVAGIFKDLLAPVLRWTVNEYAGNANAVKGGFCFGEFKGDDVNKARPGQALNNHGCHAMPLKTNQQYLITSLGVPAAPFQSICPGAVDPKELLYFCTAVSMCDGLPTVGFMISGSLVACALGNGGAAAGTGGLSLALSQGVKAGLNRIGFGFSLSASFEYGVTVWDGDRMVNAKVDANYFDYVKVNFDVTEKWLKIPSVFEISGTQTRAVNILGDNPGATIDALATSTGPQDALGKAFSNFAAVYDLKVSVAIKLSKVTGGALPDTPPLKLASFSAVASAQPKSATGVPQGFYATCRGVSIVQTLVKEFFAFLSQSMGGIIDALFGKGAMKGFADALSPGTSDDTIFAFAGNADQIGFFLQAPVAGILFGPFAGDIAGMFSIACKVRLSNGEFSCEVEYKEPKWLTVVAEAAVYVAKEAKKFFEKTGKIIAVVAKKAANDAVEWTEEAIKDAGQAIEDGAIIVGDAVSKWAKEGGGYVYCGAEYIADGTVCGVDFIADGVVCGWDHVTDAVICGSRVVTDAVLCGVDWVEDAVLCGTKTISSVAICGWDFLGELCSGCSGCSGCSWGGCSGCSGCSGCFNQKVPASCKVALSCDKPRTCSVPLSCQIGRKCNVPRSCDIAKLC